MPLRIAQVAPLYESVPPRFYGGTERVVSYLTEELVRRGHEVALFASGDSVTQARLIAPCKRALRLDPACADQLAYHMVQLGMLLKEIAEFDVVHFHIDYLHFPVSQLITVPSLTTLHGRLDLPDLVPLYREFADIPVVSISNAQRMPLPWLNWLGTVYHGLPRDLFAFRETRGTYLAFLGRISPEKGVEDAIEIAKRAGMTLKIAAKVDPVDRAYFEADIKPLLRDPHIEYVGEITEHEKQDFLGNAYALLFAINWPEPFGLVMIEAMACGTPTIAYRRGSVPEVTEDGKTGFICTRVDEAVAALDRVAGLSRRRCREIFETRFTVHQMVDGYLDLYHKLLSDTPLAAPRSTAA